MSFSPKAKWISGTPVMVDHTPVGAVSAGDVLLIANGKLGIAHVDIAAGALGAVSEGRAVYDLNNNTGQSYTDRALVYWDTTNSFATTSTSNTLGIGTAIGVTASSSSASTVRVLVDALSSFKTGT